MGALGGVIGGAMGSSMAADDRGQARDDANRANEIIQSLQNAPDASRPILLEKYRQAGLISPQMEAAISAGPSKMEGVTTNGKGIAAQEDALKQMQQRAATGMTSTDRAALADAQQQSGTEERAKQAQILQQFAQRGQLGSGAQLAAQLQSAQGGANEQSRNALDVMGRSQQQALQAAAQAGGLGSNLESQQFGEASQKAQAADQMNRFNVQNQIGANQRNTASQNQAQLYNLGNQQNVMNQNTQAQNQEYNRQRQGEQQNFNNQLNLAGVKSGSLKGHGAWMQDQGDRTAQSMKDEGTGIGGIAESAIGFAQGGQVDFKNGGHVQGQANVPGDSPENDTVDAKLSPGEIVVPRSLAQSELGDKLLALLNAHHEIKTHLDKADGKAKKAKQKVPQGFADGTPNGPVQQPMSPGLPPITEMNGIPVGPDGYPLDVPDTVKANFTQQEAIQHALARQKYKPSAPAAPVRPSLSESASEFFPRIIQQQEGGVKPGFADGGQVGLDTDFAEKFKKGSGFAQGGKVHERGSLEHMSSLMDQFRNPKKKYNDGTVEEEGGVVPSNPMNLGDIPINADIGPYPGEQEEAQLVTDQSVPGQIQSQIDELGESGKKLPEPKESDSKLEESIPKDSKNEVSQKPLEKVSESKEESSNEKPEEEVEEESPKNKLEAAQGKRRLRQTLADMARFGDLVGAGIAQAKPVSPSYFDALKKSADTPIDEYNEQIANQKNDPNSQASMMYRDAYKQIMGKEANPKASAADIAMALPLVEKYMQAQQTTQAKKDKQASDLEFKYEKLQQDHQMKLEGAKDKKERDAINNDFRQQMLDVRKDMVAMSGSRLGLSASSKIENDDTIKRANNRINSADTALTQLNDTSQPLTMNRLNAIQIDLANTLNFMSNAGASDYKAKSDKLENLNTMIAAAKQRYGTSLVDLRKEAPEVYKEVRAYAQSVKDSIGKIKEKREKELQKKYTTSIGEDSTASQRLNKAYGDDEKVVVEKDGKQFKLPKAQLEQALKQGYSQVQ